MATDLKSDLAQAFEEAASAQMLAYCVIAVLQGEENAESAGIWPTGLTICRHSDSANRSAASASCGGRYLHSHTRPAFVPTASIAKLPVPAESPAVAAESSAVKTIGDQAMHVADSSSSRRS